MKNLTQASKLVTLSLLVISLFSFMPQAAFASFSLTDGGDAVEIREYFDGTSTECRTNTTKTLKSGTVIKITTIKPGTCDEVFNAEEQNRNKANRLRKKNLKKAKKARRAARRK